MLTDDKLKNLIGTSFYTNDKMLKAQKEWSDWYRGTDSWHTIQINNGLQVKTHQIYRMNMAERVAEDWCSAIMSDSINVDIISNKGVKMQKATSAFIQGSNTKSGGVFGTTNFWYIFNNALEEMFALGTHALCIGYDNIGIDKDFNIVKTDETKITFKTYNCFEIKPISYSNNIVTEAAFITEQVKGKNKYDILTTYTLDNDKTYVITNRVFKEDGREVQAQEIGLIPYMRTNSKLPYFFILRTVKCNTLCYNSPLGESVFSDSMDTLRCLDLTYNCLRTEILSGQRIILFNKSLLCTDDNGNIQIPQDSFNNYMQFYSDEMSNTTENYIKEFHPSLNTKELSDSLQMQLNLLSSKCGLGKSIYKLDNNTEVTATEVRISAKGQSRNIKRQSLMLEQTLQNIIRTLIDIGVNVLKMNIDEDARISVTLRPLSSEDIELERKADLELVKEKIISVNEYRRKWLPELGELQDDSTDSDKNITD